MAGKMIFAAVILIGAQITLAATEKDLRYYCNGECDVERDRCSCKDTCMENKTCCTDYQESCQGGTSWKDTECTAAGDMVCPSGYKAPVVILSIDGFRDIYFNRNFTPTIKKLANCGIKAPYMRSAYPTKTFPNHYTIATGLYPESHGIISNTIFDHEKEEKFRPGRPASFSPHWWGGEPIWVSASDQGLKSATYFWPGGEINITRYPDYYLPYNKSTPLEERVYKFLEWIDKPEDDRPSMILLYNSVVDSAGHKYGPFGGTINDTLVQSDEMVEMIMNGLRDRKLDTCVNFIITSDHGMASVDCTNKFVYLDDFGVNVSEVTYDAGPFVRIGKSLDKSLWSKFDPIDTINKLKCKNSVTHWKAYLKNEYLPKRYHYANNKWIEDVHLVMDDEHWSGVKDDEDCDPGGHGYDNAYADMRAFFTAHGPGFKRSYVKDDPFENIELYNLMAGLLGITAAPNNGTDGSLNDILKNTPNVDSEPNGIDPMQCPLIEGVSDCESCQGITQSDVDEKLTIDSEQADAYEEKHALYGRPRIFREGSEFCQLTQSSYLSSYDQNLRISLVTSFVLTGNENLMVTNSTCVMQDSRVDNYTTFDCSASTESESNLPWGYLFPPGIADESSGPEALISSNIVPVYVPFTKVWAVLEEMLSKWSKEFGGITVDVGPIYDYNYDGHYDSDDFLIDNATYKVEGPTPVPTHYFLLSTRCKESAVEKTIQECSDSPDDIEVFSLIIPNYKEDPCHEANVPDKDWVPAALLPHVSRIKDIELLTGVSFFTKWVTDGASQDERVKSITKKLYLPEASDPWVQEFMQKSGSEATTMNPEVTTTSASYPISASVVTMIIVTLMSFFFII